MAEVPVDPLRIIEAVRTAPVVDDGRAAVDQRRARSAREDALLLLRAAVRHPAQGPRQRGDRLRAVGGLPVQSRHAVPEGREALPAGLASRSADDGAAARYVLGVGLQPAAVRRGHRRVAAEIGRIQQTHGAGAIGVLGGASLTTEKTYLLGKFARVCLKTPFIDYNGRLCMVSAGAANKKAFGIDRTTNPWSDMVGTDVIWVAGSNVAECSPITTNYIWQAREQGAKIIVQDPRITPAARTCDLYLPVKPGRDAALFAGVLQIMIERDWLDHAFIDAHTVGFEQVAEYCREWTLPRTAEVTGVPQRALMQAAEWWGTAKTSFLFHARGIEHHSNGVQNSLGTINLVLASGRIGKPKSGYGTIVGQANGQGGREHGQKCDQLPGWRDISNPEHRRYIAGVWGIDEQELPGPASTPTSCSARSIAARSRGCCRSASTRRCRCRTTPSSRAASRSSSSTPPSTSSSTTPPGTPTSCCRAACTRRTKARSRRSRAASSRSTRRWTARARRARTGASSRTSRRRSAGRTASRSREPREIFEELRVASKGGVADYSGVTYEKITQQLGVFWPCYSEDPQTGAAIDDHPGTPRLFERGSYNPVAKGQRPVLLPGRPRAVQRRRVSPAGRRCERGVSDLPDDRPGRQPVPVRHADAPHRTAGEAVRRAADRDASAAGGEARASRTATGRRPRRGAGPSRCGRRW